MKRFIKADKHSENAKQLVYQNIEANQEVFNNLLANFLSFFQSCRDLTSNIGT